MVWVIEGKIVEKWFEGQQKLLWVNLGKITVTGCMKSVKEIHGEIDLSKRDVRVSAGSNNRDD